MLPNRRVNRYACQHCIYSFCQIGLPLNGRYRIGADEQLISQKRVTSTVAATEIDHIDLLAATKERDIRDLTVTWIGKRQSYPGRHAR